jgi:hypothetical protein
MPKPGIYLFAFLGIIQKDSVNMRGAHVQRIHLEKKRYLLGIQYFSK